MKNEESGKLTNESYLKFMLHEESYAIPLLMVKEVIALPEVTPLPHTPKYFLGMMNLRGQIISLIDLRSKLGVKNEFNSETTVIICEKGAYCIGIAVNTVESVFVLSENEIKPKPQIEASHSTEYIRGVYGQENELIILIDVFKALDLEDKTVMQKLEKAA